MKFSEKYPDATTWDYVESGNYIYGTYDNCYICGRMTNFVEINYGCHICSEECEAELNRQALHHCCK